MKLLSILLFYFAFVDDSSFAEKQQHSMLRRQTDAVGIESTSNNQSNGPFLERHLKSSKKGSKSSKGTKSKSKFSKSKSKSNKSAKSTNSSDQDVTVPSVAPTKSAVTILEDIISSVVENNDFSSYNQDDFDVAKTWFLTPSNHPSDFRMNGDEYMKERFILALIYSANCKKRCTLPDNWFSAKDHCEWVGVTCELKEITDLTFHSERFRGFELRGKFTMFGMKSLKSIDLSYNNLSGTFTVAGPSPSLTYLASSWNKLTGFIGGGNLKNLETLDLFKNEFEGDFIVDKKNLPISLKSLDLSRNKLSSFVGGGVLTNLEDLHLWDNRFVGDYIVDERNIPASIKKLDLYENQLTSFVGGGRLSNLEKLFLDDNKFAGDFIVNEENLPTSLKSLDLSGNKLTGYVDRGILKNLEDLDLGRNEIAGDFIINEEIPTSIIFLRLNENKLTGFVNGGTLTNLEELRLNDNEFKGDVMLTAANFPTSLKALYLNQNRMTSIDAESSVVPQLKVLSVKKNPFKINDGIIVKQGLCNRRPGLKIKPNDACLPA